MERESISMLELSVILDIHMVCQNPIKSANRYTLKVKLRIRVIVLHIFLTRWRGLETPLYSPTIHPPQWPSAPAQAVTFTQAEKYNNPLAADSSTNSGGLDL